MELRYDIEKMEKLKERVRGISLNVEELNATSKEIAIKIQNEDTPKVISMVNGLVLNNINSYLDILKENTDSLEKGVLEMKELVIETDEEISSMIEEATDEPK